MYSACASRVIPRCSQRVVKPSCSKAGRGASLEGIDQELPTTNMLIVTCGDSYTQGEGLEKQSQAYPYLLSACLNAELKNLAQSGASEYLITSQVEQAVKLNPDLIVIGHTSEYRWQVWDFRNNCTQGFLVANWVKKHGKSYRNWIFSEQIIGNRRKDTHEHKAAWHAAGMLYYSEHELVERLWSSAVAKQIVLCQRAGIPVIHHCCFPHLQNALEELTNDYVVYHLDKEKHKNLAPDNSHAGAKCHLELSQIIMNKHQPIL